MLAIASLCCLLKIRLSRMVHGLRLVGNAHPTIKGCSDTQRLIERAMLIFYLYTIGKIDLLRQLYNEVVIPTAVFIAVDCSGYNCSLSSIYRYMR